jgi:prepilin-type processing-associated H-X9-DG protein
MLHVGHVIRAAMRHVHVIHRRMFTLRANKRSGHEAGADDKNAFHFFVGLERKLPAMEIVSTRLSHRPSGLKPQNVSGKAVASTNLGLLNSPSAINSNDTMRAFKQPASRRKAFTLLELVVVVGCIAIIAALIMPVLAKAKGHVQGASCKNNLHQTGLALQMYVSDNNIYPPAVGGGPPFKTWADRLARENPLKWTNRSWHCPTYIAEGGQIVYQPPAANRGTFHAWSSYSYNAIGMSGSRFIGGQGFRKGEWLGLGDLNLTVPENRIASPSEMYAVADSRPMKYENTEGFYGRIEMQPWKLLPSALGAKIIEAPAPHGEGYNLLFADGHVNLEKRKDYLYPPRTAKNWNRDHKPHPELWSPKSEWAVRN